MCVSSLEDNLKSSQIDFVKYSWRISNDKRNEWLRQEGTDENTAVSTGKAVYPVAGAEVSGVDHLVAVNDDDDTVGIRRHRLWDARGQNGQLALAVGLVAVDLSAVVHRLLRRGDWPPSQ